MPDQDPGATPAPSVSQPQEDSDLTPKPNDKHLALVQGVVNRLAGNSFALKGWSVTLVSALLALAAKDANVWLVAIALLPALTFWGLDGYFLGQERLFRGLYAKLIDPN